MNLKQLSTKLEPVFKMGGWLYWCVGLIAAAAAWVTTTQLAVASNSEAVKDLRQQIRPIEQIRQDVRWIKKRLGGPDN
jgi:hypothetical protein